MKIRRTGVHRQHGVDTLVSTEKPLRANWKPESGHLTVWVRGRPGATTHQYGVDFTPTELASLVEAALLQTSTDRSGKALATAVGAYIRAAFAGDQPNAIKGSDDDE